MGRAKVFNNILSPNFVSRFQTITSLHMCMCVVHCLSSCPCSEIHDETICHILLGCDKYVSRWMMVLFFAYY